MVRYSVILLFLTIAVTGCSTGRNHAAAMVSGPVVLGPAVYVDSVVLTQNREAACALIDGDRISDIAAGAYRAGMLQTDFEALREVSLQKRVVATFRDSNQSCLPHLAAGVQSKPHSILQKTWDSSNLLPKDAHKAGLVSNLMKKPAKGEKIADPQLTLHNGEPVSCDYDLMDLAEEDGERIPGESRRELEIRDAMNAALPPTVQGHRNRIMHGSQAGYGQYAVIHLEEPVITALFKPEAPVTAFSSTGAVFRLESVEKVLSFYRCQKIGLPVEWNIESKGKP